MSTVPQSESSRPNDQSLPGEPGDEKPPLPASDSDHDWAWKWFELHVGHRTNVINFLLIAFGALAVAYADLLSTKPVIAGAVGVVAGTIALCFLRLDFVTMAKINDAKAILSSRTGPTARLFTVEPRMLGDRAVTRVFVIVIAIASFLAAWFAWRT